MGIWLPTCRRISLVETGLNDMVTETESFTIYAQKKYAKMNGLLKQKRRQFVGDGLRFLIAFYIDLKRTITTHNFGWFIN